MAPSKIFPPPKCARKPTAKAMAAQQEEESTDEDPQLEPQACLTPQANSLHSSIGLGSDGDDRDSGGDISNDEDGQSGKGVAEEEDE